MFTSEPWQASGEEDRSALHSPLPYSCSSLSPLHISPSISPHTSPSPSLDTLSAVWPFHGRSPSSCVGSDRPFDYRADSVVSPSHSVDRYFVSDRIDPNARLSPPFVSTAPFTSLPPPSARPVDVSPPPFFVSPVPTDERALRRKLKHKLLDTDRRRRETTAIQSLARLTAATSISDTSCTAISAADTERQHEAATKNALAVRRGVDGPQQYGLKRRKGGLTAGNLTGECVKRDNNGSSSEQLAKVDVLERTVASLERAVADNHNKDRRIATLQFQLHAALAALAKKEPKPLLSGSASTAARSSPDTLDVRLSPSALTLVSAVDRSQCLSLCSFIRPQISLLSISLPHFRIVDANSAHRKLTGWSDEYIVNKLIAWSMSKDEYRRSDVAGIVKRVHQRENGDVWVQKVTQYPASGLALRELLRGNKEKVDMIWRMCKSDGRLYETQCSFWLGGGVSLDEGAEQWSDDSDISHINSPGDINSELSGIEAAAKRLNGRYLIVAAAWQDSTEVSS